MKGNFSIERTWSLRHLLDLERSKATQLNLVSAIVHNFPGTNLQLLYKVSSLYIPIGDRQALSSNSGEANAEINV